MFPLKMNDLFKVVSLRYINDLDFLKYMISAVDRSYSHRRYYLPTEFHIDKPQYVTPNLGIIKELDLFIRNETVLSYSELEKLPDFEGTSNEETIVAVEFFREVGDDGHILHELEGYIFLPRSFIDVLFEKHHSIKQESKEIVYYTINKNFESFRRGSIPVSSQERKLEYYESNLKHLETFNSFCLYKKYLHCLGSGYLEE